MDKLRAFLATPLGKFCLDVADSAVLGAALVAVALPDSVSAKEAIGLIAGGAIGAIKGAARAFLLAYISARKTAS